MKSRDRRFDGVFYIAVRTTGIYCRPSCPARTPGFANVTSTPAPPRRRAAGYRACKRCLPDATPGSPDWDVAADVAGRAMRLISDGVVDREGVEGLARRVGYTPRHLVAGAHRRARRRPARAGPGQARPDRAGADRDHRPRPTPTSPSRPASRASGSSTTPCARSTPPARPTCAAAAADGAAHRARSTMRLAVRTPFAGRALLDFLAYHLGAGRRGRRRRVVRPHPRPAARPRHRAARHRRRARGRARPRSSPRHVRARRPARHRGRRRAGAPARSTPTATRSRSPTTSPATPSSARWPGARPDCGCRARSTATRSRCAP